MLRDALPEEHASINRTQEKESEGILRSDDNQTTSRKAWILNGGIVMTPCVTCIALGKKDHDGEGRKYE